MDTRKDNGLKFKHTTDIWNENHLGGGGRKAEINRNYSNHFTKMCEGKFDTFHANIVKC